MEKISEVDNLTGYIQRKLVENQLENRVNVIHLSDHGMVEVAKSNIIDLTQYLKYGTYQMYQSSPIIQVVPINHGELENNRFFLSIKSTFVLFHFILIHVNILNFRIFQILSVKFSQI